MAKQKQLSEKLVMDWEDEFRPRKFRDVRGQPQAIKQVSGRIIRGVPPRALLLTGAVGSGKTTIVRIAASALNCEAVEFDGSPCCKCNSCMNPSRYLIEWDTTGRGGDLACVSALVQQNLHSVEAGKYRVIFFDECHALKREAQDALLKPIEDRSPGIVFCFATTEPDNIRPALSSRLDKIRIYPIRARDAYEYLELIARQKNVTFDAEALHFLVAAKPPFVRDLIIGLQELAELGQHLTIGLVKEHLGLQICDHLAAYMRSLASGNHSEQIRAMQEWPDDIIEKRLLVERFVSSAYYNDVIGVEYIVDPLLHGLADARRDFVQGLQERFRLDRAGLKRVFRAMMTLWSTNAALTASGAYTVLGLFEAMMSDGFDEACSSGSKALVREDTQNVPSIVQASSAFESLDRSLSPYLTATETREIANRASFFAQDNGEYLNTSISLLLRGGLDLEFRADGSLASFIQMLDRGLKNQPSAFAAFGVLEREQSVIVARVLAYVHPEWRSEFLHSVSAWSSPGAEVIEAGFNEGAAGHTFQWSKVRDICASCDETIANGTAVRGLLKIPRRNWRDAGPLACKRVHFSELLSERYIEEACFPALTPLSAFDAAASEWIDGGWEVGEALIRRRELAARRRRLEALQFQWRDNRARLEAEETALLESWRKMPPEQRSRGWRGWW